MTRMRKYYGGQRHFRGAAEKRLLLRAREVGCAGENANTLVKEEHRMIEEEPKEGTKTKNDTSLPQL